LVVNIDYNKKPLEAIRDVGGMEERATLVEGDGDFAECTWKDGTKWQSRVANLMLSVERAPLRVGSKFAKKPKKDKPAAAKKPAKKPDKKLLKKPKKPVKKPAKKPAKPEDDDDEEEEDEEEEQECDEEQEQEDEEEEEEDAAVDAGDKEGSAPVPAKKAKTGEPQELQPTCTYILARHTHKQYMIYIYICISILESRPEANGLSNFFSSAASVHLMQLS